MTKHFTDEQIEILRKNPYAKKVSLSTITYTEEFRELFAKKYESGKIPFQIFRDAGFDPKMLGKERIHSFRKRVKKMMQRDDGFKDTRNGHSGRPSTRDLTPEEEIQRLQQKLKYLQQENTFLKKSAF